MSEENVAIARRTQEGFLEGGIEAALSGFAPDVIAYPFPEWVEDSEYRGHDGLRTLIAIWTDNFDEFEIHIHEFRDLGDQVLCLGETAGKIKGSAQPIRQELGSSTPNFRGGQIGETRNFLSWAQAKEEAGVES